MESRRNSTIQRFGIHFYGKNLNVMLHHVTNVFFFLSIVFTSYYMSTKTFRSFATVSSITVSLHSLLCSFPILRNCQIESDDCRFQSLLTNYSPIEILMIRFIPFLFSLYHVNFRFHVKSKQRKSLP